MAITHMKLSDIRIPYCFSNSTPREEKLSRCRSFYKENNMLDRELVVNQSNFLIDGYIGYLVLKENNIEDCTVRISKHGKIFKSNYISRIQATPYKRVNTTYVYGYHPGDKNHKIRVWRITPGTIHSELTNIDNTALVDTSVGVALIKITKIETLSSPPVGYTIKPVVAVYAD